jgi:hypothetical protein
MGRNSDQIMIFESNAIYSEKKIKRQIFDDFSKLRFYFSNIHAKHSSLIKYIQFLFNYLN